MADTSIAVTPGAGANVGTRTTAGGKHRQVIVIGDESVDAAVAPVSAASGLTVNTVPATAGGCSRHHFVSAATTNAGNVKASPGQLFGVRVFAKSAYPIYVKVHNVTGSPTVGTTPVEITIAAQAGQPGVYSNPLGSAFSAGIARSVTKGIADNDTQAVAAEDCVVDFDFK